MLTSSLENSLCRRCSADSHDLNLLDCGKELLDCVFCRICFGSESSSEDEDWSGCESLDTVTMFPRTTSFFFRFLPSSWLIIRHSSFRLPSVSVKIIRTPAFLSVFWPLAAPRTSVLMYFRANAVISFGIVLDLQHRSHLGANSCAACAGAKADGRVMVVQSLDSMSAPGASASACTTTRRFSSCCTSHSSKRGSAH